MSNSTTYRLATVSDLHLFCPRSRADRYQLTMRAAAQESDVFVLNGDIFDFRWSTMPSPERTVEAALEWLSDFVDAAPHCRFHYVLGNHDHYGLLMDALPGFSSARSNFDWSTYYWRFGPALFLHGDVANGTMTAEQFMQYRQGWLNDANRGPLSQRVFDVAFLLGLHRAISYFAFPRNVVIKRLHHYVEDIGHGPDRGVKTVYFGHTHKVIPEHEHEGVRYRNSGAAMPGVPFHILREDVPVERVTAANLSSAEFEPPQKTGMA
jgi:UDP-2,3-diacylglucosamine pyrophosphatase LpxH